MDLAEARVIEGVTYLFNYFQIGPWRDADFLIMRAIAGHMNSDFKAENRIIVMRKKNSSLEEAIEFSERYFDILIYLGDENPQTKTRESRLKVYSQYWHPGLPNHVHSWPVFTNNPNFLRCSVNREVSKNIDFFYSGNLNRNRMSMFCDLMISNSFLRHIIHYSLKRIPFKVSKKISLYFLHKKVDDARLYIKFTSKFGAGLNQNEYHEKIQTAKFTLCPKGFLSPWTFRIYEAIISDSVPVLLKNHFDGFNPPPALFVESWDEIHNLDHSKCSQIYENKISEVRKFRETWLTPNKLAQYVEGVTGKQQ